MTTLNTTIFYFINTMAGHHRALDSVMVFVTIYAPYILFVLGITVLFIASRRKKTVWRNVFFVGQVVELALSIVVGWFGAKLLKIIVALPRPFSTLSDVQQLVDQGDYSFPSNHAVVVFTIATIVYLYHKKVGVLFYIAATIVALSRVYVGVHYPLDILVGALIGSAVPVLIHKGFSQIEKNKVQYSRY